MPFCSRCGKELPSDAKFCLECGASVTEPIPPPPIIPAKLESKTGRNIVIAIAMIFLLLGVGALGYGVYEANKRSPITPTPIKQYEVIIRYSERYADQIKWIGSDVYLPPKHEGYTYLIITLNIENKIDRKIDTYDLWFKVIVNNVQYSSSVMTMCLDDSLKAVELHKGGIISGSIVFEVPKGTGLSYTLIYEHPGEDWNIEWIHY